MIIPIFKKVDCNCQVSESEFLSEAPIDSLLRLLHYANKGDDWKITPKVFASFHAALLYLSNA